MFAAPSLLCFLAGTVILCLPMFWKLRAAGRSYERLGLRIVRNCIRVSSLGLVLIVLIVAARMPTSGVKGLLFLASILGVLAALAALADLLARLILGPKQMDIDPEIRRGYWRSCVSIGLGLLLASGLLFISGSRLS